MVKNRILLNDVCLVAFFVLLAVVLFLLGNSVKKAGVTAVVCIDGKEVARYSLSENNQYVLNNGTNTLVVENGYAYVCDADCPDKLCVKQGKIKNEGQCITCLPNKLTVSISGRKSEMDFVL